MNRINTRDGRGNVWASSWRTVTREWGVLSGRKSTFLIPQKLWLLLVPSELSLASSCEFRLRFFQGRSWIELSSLFQIVVRFGSVNVIGLQLTCCERCNLFISPDRTVTKDCLLCQSSTGSRKDLHSDGISQLNVPAVQCVPLLSLPLLPWSLFISTEDSILCGHPWFSWIASGPQWELSTTRLHRASFPALLVLS